MLIPKVEQVGRLVNLASDDSEYWNSFNFSVTYTPEGGVATSIDVISPEVFWDEMLDHFSWKFIRPGDSELSPEDEESTAMMFFYQRWCDFVAKQEPAVYDWIVDTLVKHIDPLVTGWSKVSQTRTRNNFGYTDNVARYMVSNVATGYNKEITLGSGTSLASKITVGAKAETGYTTTSEGGRLGYSNTHLGKLNSLTLNTQAHTVTATEATGEDVTTSVQTGTFNRQATEDNPFTQKDTNKGSTAGDSGEQTASETSTTGSNYSDSYEQSEGGRTYTGSETVDTNKEANDGNLVQNMKYWIENDLVSMLLQKFCHDELFYSEGCDV